MPSAGASSYRGEVALQQIALRIADYRTYQRTEHAAAIGRHFDGWANVHDENTLVDIVAVVEHFSTERLLELSSVVTQAQIKDWMKRIDVWCKVTTVNPRSFPNLQAFLGFVDVRNALAHGNGHLTDLQLTKYRASVLDQLRAANVLMDGDRIRIGSADIERCTAISTALIRYLDRARKAP